jgi:Tfp pilus assembly protein PilN
LAEQLNRKHRWSELLIGVTQCLPDTAVLTRLESDPPKCGNASLQAVQVRAPAEKNASVEPTDVANGLIISGVATDHGSVATFLRNLNTRGRVGRCLLESTMRQPYLTGEGVMFTIKTKW